MNIDLAREYVVILNGGSGCLIQPMTEEYMYVLTAKHNITDNNNQLEKIVHFKFQNNSWEQFEIKMPNFIEGQHYFPHPNKDIAIIKVPALPGYDKTFRFDRITEEKNDFFLLGYPEVRRKNQPSLSEWFRRDGNIQIADPRDNCLFEATVPGNATLKEIRGDSGGAILKVVGNQLYVAGIQNKMAAGDEQLGKVHFTSLAGFDEIIQANIQNLSPIFPCHLKSFSFLKNDAFNLNAGFGQENIEFVKGFLKKKADEVVNSPLTPIGIKNLFESKLLLYNKGHEILQSKILWLLWLEFLTILNLLKNEQLSENALKGIFNNIRLICSDTEEDWSSELDNIIYSDYRGLKRNGIVIVGCKKPPINELYILDKKIPMISQAIKKHDGGLLQIDSGMNFPLTEYKFIHIEYFKSYAIVNKHADYSEIIEDEALLEKLKNEYQILLENG